MAKKYVALKRFGGGKKLRTLYGTGTARMVQMGTVIKASDMTATHCEGLCGLGLIEEYDPKKTYVTQAMRDARRYPNPAKDADVDLDELKKGKLKKKKS